MSSVLIAFKQSPSMKSDNCISSSSQAQTGHLALKVKLRKVSFFVRIIVICISDMQSSNCMEIARDFQL